RVFQPCNSPHPHFPSILPPLVPLTPPAFPPSAAKATRIPLPRRISEPCFPLNRAETIEVRRLRARIRERPRKSSIAPSKTIAGLASFPAVGVRRRLTAQVIPKQTQQPHPKRMRSRP